MSRRMNPPQWRQRPAPIDRRRGKGRHEPDSSKINWNIMERYWQLRQRDLSQFATKRFWMCSKLDRTEIILFGHHNLM